jgi:hypothetical protein
MPPGLRPEPGREGLASLGLSLLGTRPPGRVSARLSIAPPQIRAPLCAFVVKYSRGWYPSESIRGRSLVA